MLRANVHVSSEPDQGDLVRGPVTSRATGAVMKLVNNWKRRSRHKKYYRKLKGGGNIVKIVSEGDSWFQHPLVTDLIDHLMNAELFEQYAIRSIGAAGDTLTNMIRENEFAKYVAQEEPRFFLLSAGGNDIIGEQFPGLISTYAHGDPFEQVFKIDAFHQKLEQMRSYYADIVRQVTQIDAKIQVIAHSYAYPGIKRGKWLTRHMETCNFSKEMQTKTIQYLINEFHNQVLKPTVDQFSTNFSFVDVRRFLPIESDWSDEIHPSGTSSFHIANAFHKHMAALMVHSA